MELEKLKYPIGRHSFKGMLNQDEKNELISVIDTLPDKVAKHVHSLSPIQLATPYRPGGWTVNQLVHHLSDSHLNALSRVKFALTEDKPTIMPYDEDAWVRTPDASLDLDIPLNLLKYIHIKWTHIFKNLSEEQYQKKVFHPSSKIEMSVEYLLSLYGWHSRHHLAHITELIKREDW